MPKTTTEYIRRLTADIAARENAGPVLGADARNIKGTPMGVIWRIEEMLKRDKFLLTVTIVNVICLTISILRFGWFV